MCICSGDWKFLNFNSIFFRLLSCRSLNIWLKSFVAVATSEPGLPSQEGELCDSKWLILSSTSCHKCMLCYGFSYSMMPRLHALLRLAFAHCLFGVLFSCLSIKFLVNFMPLHWVISHQPTFITALMFVMMDLTNEVRKTHCYKHLIHLEYSYLYFQLTGTH